ADKRSGRWKVLSQSALQSSEALLVKFPYPDVPETDRLAGVAVRLKLNGRCIVFLVKRLADIASLAFQLKMILHQHAIEEDCDVCGRFQRAAGIEDRSRTHHV